MLLLVVPLVALAGCRSQPEAPSFVVVSMDTFRADRLGSRDGRGLSRTPSLDAIAAQSLVFTKAYSQANETLFSHGSLFTGRYPSEIAPVTYADFRLPDDAPTFAARLSQAGWRTEAVVAGGHLSPDFHLYPGFQRYTSMSDFGFFAETVPVALHRLDVLGRDDRPFLLLVHGYDAHAPYTKPGPLFRLETPGYAGSLMQASWEPFVYERIYRDGYYPDFVPALQADPAGRVFPSPANFELLARHAERFPEGSRKLSQEDLGWLKSTYETAITSVDWWMGVLDDGLRERGLADDAYLVIVSDHGEDLLEHDFFNHRVSLHDANTHVVLLVRGPGIEPGIVDTPVALSDVYCTILALSGVASPPDMPHFEDLLGTHDPDRAIVSESARGEVSVRTRLGRLITPVSTVSGWFPSEAPKGSWVGDDAGTPMAWDDPRAAMLWQALWNARP